MPPHSRGVFGYIFGTLRNKTSVLYSDEAFPNDDFQFMGTDQIVVPLVGASFIGGQLGQDDGFLPPGVLGVHTYDQQNHVPPDTIDIPLSHALFRRPQYGIRSTRQHNGLFRTLLRRQWV